MLKTHFYFSFGPNSDARGAPGPVGERFPKAGLEVAGGSLDVPKSTPFGC